MSFGCVPPHRLFQPTTYTRREQRYLTGVSLFVFCRAKPARPFERRHGTMEKVISEFQVIETEDGFRVEIKGDKETIRRMLSGFGFCDSFKGKAPFGRG